MITEEAALQLIREAIQETRNNPDTHIDVIANWQKHKIEELEFRDVEEISEAENELMLRVWYNRKLVMLEAIRDGRMEMPTEEIMDGMTKGMRDMESKYKPNELVYDDFEWGMINGKLSALRWVMGEEWDELYT